MVEPVAGTRGSPSPVAQLQRPLPRPWRGPADRRADTPVMRAGGSRAGGRGQAPPTHSTRPPLGLPPCPVPWSGLYLLDPVSPLQSKLQESGAHVPVTRGAPGTQESL